MHVTDLGGADWTVRAVGGPVPDEITERLRAGIPATVPGVVHLDLLAAGLIPDPYDGDNEARVQWIGLTDWEFSRTFEWQPGAGSRHDLVAGGLDTVAQILLNGVEVGRTANQHRSYRFDVRHALRPGANELSVRFAAPVPYARAQAQKLGPRPHAYHHPFNAIRKTAANFGWDWGPDLATSGIWRDLTLESWSGVRVAGVRPITSITDGVGRLAAHVALEWAGEAEGAEVSVSIDGRERRLAATYPQSEVTAEFAIDGVRLWQPRGYGSPDRYELTVTAGSTRWRRLIGFRTVAVDTTADAIGQGFAILVNGQRVYVHGFNWIPDDTFFPRITRESLAASLDHAVAANANLIRVWGGGLYESEDFYDLCDELGLLVWQDFLLACAAYSEEGDLAAEFEAEAREAVARLSAHPSLAVWNGGNENLWGFASWGWRGRLQGATWGDGYYRELFPRIVAELAPGTPYLSGSPDSFAPYLHPNDPDNGTCHIWDVWNQVDYTHYRRYRPRFVSEFGFQGPPNHATLTAVVHDEPLDPFGPQMLVHQKAVDGNGKLQRGLGEHLPPLESFDDWHFGTQLNQARAVAYGIEWFRSIAPRNSGAIVWQLNDCWPVVSWAAVDGHGRRKPLWYALRRAFADRLLTFQPDGRAADPADAPLVLAAHNDSAEPWRARVALTRLGFDGTVHERMDTTIEVEPRGIAIIDVPASLRAPGDPAREVLVAETGGERALHWFEEDPRLALEGEALEVTATADGGDVVLALTARAVVKDLVVNVDRIDPGAVADDALITLLPGERREVRIRTSERDAPERFATHPVLRAANDLVSGIPVVFSEDGPGPRERGGSGSAQLAASPGAS